MERIFVELFPSMRVIAASLVGFGLRSDAVIGKRVQDRGAWRPVQSDSIQN